MSRSLSRLAFAGGASALVACSLLVDTTGFSEPLDDADAAPDVRGASDAPADASADRADEQAPCLPASTVTEAFTATLGPFVGKTYEVDGYPRVEDFFGTSAAVLYPFVDVTPQDAGPDAAPIVAPELTSSHSGLWLPAPVSLRAFDADFDVHVRCTSASSCADGVILAWLDTTQVSVLTNTTTGHAAGLPASVSGGAVLVDNYENGTDETSDPPVPAIHVVRLDATKPVGGYAWNVATRPTSFLGGWHRVGVRVRGEDVSVLYDGAPWISGKAAPVARGLFGFTAGAGGQTNAAAVRNVTATFYDCVP